MASLTEDSMTIEEFRQLEREHPPRRLQIGDFTVVLDRVCMWCRGKEKTSCDVCHGMGRVRTQEGETLIEFCRDWIGHPDRPQYASHVPGTNQPEGIQYGRHS